MKKITAIILCAIAVGTLFAACSKEAKDTVTQTAAAETTKEESALIDLTALSGTVVYSEVYNMVTAPQSYKGKIIKMKGSFSVYEDEKTGKVYYACVIADATACCQQGIEFVLQDDDKLTYPEDYPALGTEITVVGRFNTYTEGEEEFCHLEDAAMTVTEKTGE